jgi:hypothetical protein
MINYSSNENEDLKKSENFFLKIPISLWLVIGYIVLAFPILVWHEKHLPLLIIILLAITALFFGSILFFISIKIYSKILKHGFHPIYEFFIIVILLIALGVSGFWENSGGRLFIFIFAFLSFILRFAKAKLYYAISMLAMVLLGNGLLSFVVLQKIEVFTAYHIFKSRFQFTEVDLSDWKLDEESSMLTNRSIPIKLKLPNNLYFHNPSDLGLKEKTGAGQIAGILSFSERDPNSYPFIRIFFFPVYVPVEDSIIKEEVIKYIQFQEKQGELEEVNEIQPNRQFKFLDRIPKNAFWTFYDILRPRYAKTGYYFLESNTGSKVLLHITENLEKGQYHEPLIQDVLDSIQLE